MSRYHRAKGVKTKSQRKRRSMMTGGGGKNRDWHKKGGNA
jgi:hypothetical protein